MDIKYPRVYAMLKAQGHCAFYALRILFDAKRGDGHALNWIKVLRGAR